MLPRAGYMEPPGVLHSPAQHLISRSTMAAPFSLFVSCAPGLEPLLAAELAELGALGPEALAGGVRASGHRRVVYRANLESGLASHVLVRVGAVVATDLGALEHGLSELPWERFLSPGVPRAFRVTARKSRIIHTGAIAERAARAIAVRLRDDRLEPDESGVPVQIRMDHDRATLSIDTSGVPLHRRGYRLSIGKAPLREDLARALVIASGWDRKSPLIDPFCGSGTIGIEAALLARGIPPGAKRGFAFERTALFDETDWKKVRESALERAQTFSPRILVGDRDASVLDAARDNAERAGVLDALEIVHASVTELPFGSERATVVTNPPYGQRLGAKDALAPLYRALGRRVRELPPGSRVALLTSDRRLGMRVSDKLETAFLTQSGGLRVRALAGEVSESVK